MIAELIVFDFDGTLFDTKKDIAAALNYALNSQGLPALSEDEIWKMTGDGTPTLVERALSKMHPEAYEVVLSKTIEYYNANFSVYTTPIQGVKVFLDGTQDIAKAIVSNKYRFLIEKVLTIHSFTQYFKAIIGKEDMKKPKPDPYVMVQLLRDLNIQPEKAIYIGDSAIDVLFAHNAGIRCCIIPSGVSEIQDIIKDGPDLIFFDYRDLLEKIQKL